MTTFQLSLARRYRVANVSGHRGIPRTHVPIGGRTLHPGTRLRSSRHTRHVMILSGAQIESFGLLPLAERGILIIQEIPIPHGVKVMSRRVKRVLPPQPAPAPPPPEPAELPVLAEVRPLPEVVEPETPRPIRARYADVVPLPVVVGDEDVKEVRIVAPVEQTPEPVPVAEAPQSPRKLKPKSPRKPRVPKTKQGSKAGAAQAPTALDRATRVRELLKKARQE